jgi:hypothetical protein
LDRSDERFERGREGGRSLSLVEAVSEVLAEGRRPAVRS